MTTSASERRRDIVELAHTSGLASVDDLSRRFDVTPSTIRRDLAQLTARGEIARTYGGAMALGPSGAEPSFRQRTGEAGVAKSSIARWARRQLVDGETILLDAGSTVSALARELRHGFTGTVATTSIAVVQQLAETDRVHVECLGGTLRVASQGFVGPLTEASLERMTFDRVFLGADGVLATGHVVEADLAQTRLKELMCRQSERVYVLADGSKLGRATFHARAALPAGWTLVTDDTATADALAEFAAAGVEVVVAD
jgi:DeoR/GlpR family transcriptional regulator of sugar metabolism